MAGKIKLGAVAMVAVAVWSEGALAQVPTPEPAPAPSGTMAPFPEPAPPAEEPAAPAPSPPAAEAPPAEAAPAEPAPDLEGPPAKPRVRWRHDPDNGQYAPEGEGEGEATDESDALPGPSGPEGWQLGGSHFVLSFERMATVLSWAQTSTVPASGSSGSPTDFTTSGTDAAFLFGGGERTPSSLPRIAVDGIIGGFTIGGTLGLASSTGKNEGNAFRGESKLVDIGGFLFGVRSGYFFSSPIVGLWLRGGFTHLSVGNQGVVAGDQYPNTPRDVKVTTTAWNFTLDPQVVVLAAPRIGITFGPLLDIPLSGKTKAEIVGGDSDEVDYKSSAYGLTAGAAAIF